MKTDEFKILWDSLEFDTKENQEIIRMLEEKRHPVLKGIRKQIIIELSSWLLFLACYYSMFDGSAKPPYVNGVLILTILIPFVHNLYGYRLVRHVADGSSIIVSLQQHLLRTRTYALQSIVSRVVFIVGLLFFFSYNIEFSPSKSLLFGGIIAVLVAVQIIALSKIWRSRIKQLKESIVALEY